MSAVLKSTTDNASQSTGPLGQSPAIAELARSTFFRERLVDLLQRDTGMRVSSEVWHKIVTTAFDRTITPNVQLSSNDQFLFDLHKKEPIAGSTYFPFPGPQFFGHRITHGFHQATNFDTRNCGPDSEWRPIFKIPETVVEALRRCGKSDITSQDVTSSSAEILIARMNQLFRLSSHDYLHNLIYPTFREDPTQAMDWKSFSHRGAPAYDPSPLKCFQSWELDFNSSLKACFPKLELLSIILHRQTWDHTFREQPQMLDRIAFQSSEFFLALQHLKQDMLNSVHYYEVSVDRVCGFLASVYLWQLSLIVSLEDPVLSKPLHGNKSVAQLIDELDLPPYKVTTDHVYSSFHEMGVLPSEAYVQQGITTISSVLTDFSKTKGWAQHFVDVGLMVCPTAHKDPIRYIENEGYAQFSKTVCAVVIGSLCEESAGTKIFSLPELSSFIQNPMSVPAEKRQLFKSIDSQLQEPPINHTLAQVLEFLESPISAPTPILNFLKSKSVILAPLNDAKQFDAIFKTSNEDPNSLSPGAAQARQDHVIALSKIKNILTVSNLTGPEIGAEVSGFEGLKVALALHSHSYSWLDTHLDRKVSQLVVSYIDRLSSSELLTRESFKQSWRHRWGPEKIRPPFLR